MQQEKIDQKIQIKALKDVEKIQWLTLWQDYQHFYQSHMSTEVTEHTWAKLTQSKHQHIYGYAALIDHQVVGIVHVIEHESCWTIKPYAYLQDLFVDPNYRGQSVARKLIQTVHHQAEQRGCDRVYWLTHESNKNAQILYDKVAKPTGFIQYRMK